MADWRKLAKALALADGRLDTKETEIIKREILSDGKLDKSELEWLVDLRNSATSVVGVFNDFFFSVVKQVVLADGEISDNEATWLSKLIFADGQVDDSEKKFMQDLKSSAKKVSASFEALYKKVVG
jgi:uncharacterized tellurite resistance protein B-like protein